MKQKGFTLIELSAVMFILSLLFFMVLPNLDTISPTFRLRSLAREIGSTIEESRSESVVNGQTYGIRYDFPNKRFGLLLPLDSGDSKSKREVLRYHPLDDSLSIDAIIWPDSKRVSSRVEDVDFDPLGNNGSHIVVIKTKGGKTMWIKFNGFTGVVTYSESELRFHTYDGN